jgi:hypothetical protein
MTYQDALNTVRKLLNRTTENGCTESEAKTAAGLAQKLMDKHRISVDVLGTIDDDADEEIRGWEDPLDEMPNRLKQHWRGSLSMVICRHNGCTVYWNHKGQKPCLSIVGRASDVSAARYLYEFVIREMETAQVKYRGNGRTWLNNWRNGFVDGIADSLREAREAARQEYAAETGTALIVVDQALVAIKDRHQKAAAFAKAKFNLRSGGGGSGQYDHGARATGKRDGKQVNVNGGGKGLPAAAKRLK